MWPILAIVAVVVAVIVALRTFKDSIAKFAAPLFASMKSIGDQMAKVGRSLWNGVKPVLELLGGAIIFSVIAAFRTIAFIIDVVVMPVFRVLASIVEFVGSILKFVFDNVVYPAFDLLGKIVGAVTEALGWLGDKVKGLVAVIADAISWISKKIGSVTGLVTKPASWLWDKVTGKKKPASSSAAPQMGPKVTPDLEKLMRLIPYAGDIIDSIKKAQQDEKDKAVLRRERPVTHNDFRGSKITVKQEFREADPDRVWVQFRKGLEQEATARTRSGFADPLAR
jgi:phage-related protein